jgi:nicotinamide-nucleotide amidase
MEKLVSLAAQAAVELKKRGATIAIAESSTGGLLSAALLAVPGASAYFLGGAVVYTRQARRALLGVTEEALVGIRPASEAYALLMARTVRQQFSSVWGLAETGATGPAGNRYGDPAGHACIAVTGPLERVVTIETGASDRLANMRAFAEAAIGLLTRATEEATPDPPS